VRSCRDAIDFLDWYIYASDVWPKPSQLFVTMTYAEAFSNYMEKGLTRAATPPGIDLDRQFWKQAKRASETARGEHHDIENVPGLRPRMFPASRWQGGSGGGRKPRFQVRFLPR
jgi:hypothetical protein